MTTIVVEPKQSLEQRAEKVSYLAVGYLIKYGAIALKGSRDITVGVYKGSNTAIKEYQHNKKCNF